MSADRVFTLCQRATKRLQKQLAKMEAPKQGRDQVFEVAEAEIDVLRTSLATIARIETVARVAKRSILWTAPTSVELEYEECKLLEPHLLVK